LAGTFENTKENIALPVTAEAFIVTI